MSLTNYGSSFVSDWEYRVLDALSAGAEALGAVCAHAGLSRTNAQSTLRMLIEREPPFAAPRPTGGWEVTPEGRDATTARARAADLGRASRF